MKERISKKTMLCTIFDHCVMETRQSQWTIRGYFTLNYYSYLIYIHTFLKFLALIIYHTGVHIIWKQVIIFGFTNWPCVEWHYGNASIFPHVRDFLVNSVHGKYRWNRTYIVLPIILWVKCPYQLDNSAFFFIHPRLLLLVHFM